MFSSQKPSLSFHPSIPLAHRANCGDIPVPENTLSAVCMAYKTGARWIECDVKATADGIMIVLHDDTLRRTSNAQGALADTPVDKMTYAQIAQYDAGSMVSPHFAGEKIPTMADFLWLIKKLNMGLVLEIKPCEGHDIETARKSVELLAQFGMLDYPRLLVQSFLVECLREVKRLQPNLNLGLLVGDWCVYTRINTGLCMYPEHRIYKCSESVTDVLKELDCTALVAYEKILSPELIANVRKETGVPYVLAWTVNNPDRANALFGSGVDAILSDDHLMITSLTQRSALLSNASLFSSAARLSLIDYLRHGGQAQNSRHDPGNSGALIVAPHRQRK